MNIEQYQQSFSISSGELSGTIQEQVIDDSDLSLITLREYTLNEHPMTQAQFKRSIDNHQIDYKFIQEIIDPQGPYQVLFLWIIESLQMRLLYASMVLVFFMSLQFNQMVYLFLPPQLSCEKKGDQNLLYTFQNDISIGRNIRPQLELQAVQTIYLPHQERLQQKVCTKVEDGDCKSSVVFVDKNTMENVTSEFQLYCKRRPIKTMIKILMFLVACAGGCISVQLSRYGKRISTFAFLIIFTSCVILYSVVFIQDQIISQPSSSNKHTSFGFHRLIPPLQEQYQPLSLSNLVDLSILQKDGQLITFGSFYIGAIFGNFGLAFSLLPYLNDFFTELSMKEVRSNLFISFSSAQLMGTLLKMFINDWRKFNLFMIGMPLLVLSLIIFMIFKRSPKESMNQFVKIQKALKLYEIDQVNKIQQKSNEVLSQENKTKVQDDLFQQFQLISDINQRTFFSREQFIIVINRLADCTPESPSFNISFKKVGKLFAFQYVTTVVIVLYLTPYFLVSTFGQAITFNLFCFGLSEILGLIMTIRFIDNCIPLKTIKYNLLVCGIVGFTITFSQFNDHCDAMQDLCPKMMIELLIICQMRFFLVLTIFALNKQIDKDKDIDGNLVTTLCYSFGLMGAIFPILAEYVMMDVQKVFILLSIFAITASWFTKLIK